MARKLTVSQGELARVLACSTRSIRRWESDGLAAARTDTEGSPRYDLVAAVQWALERERDQLPAPSPADGISFEEARRRKEAALARLRELEAEEKEGDLLPLSEHRYTLAQIAGVIRNLPTRSDFLKSAARDLGLDRQRDATPLVRRLVALVFDEIRALADPNTHPHED